VLPAISNEPSVVIMSRLFCGRIGTRHGDRILREYQAGRRALRAALYFLIFTVLVISQCRKVPYDILEQRENGKERHFVFHLTQRQRACRVRGVVSISLSDTANWISIAPNRLCITEDYRADQQKASKQIHCGRNRVR